jgi:signal peptidase II
MILLKEFRNLSEEIFKKKNLFFFLIILTLFFLDRFSKINILNNFSENSFFINDYLNIDLIWNTGIGFGILSTQSNFFYNLITFLIATVLMTLFYLLIKSENIDKIIFSIIIGGAAGNFYDRLVYKAVPDFIDLHYNNFHWFTFNLADIFISVGILTYIIRSFFIEN